MAQKLVKEMTALCVKRESIELEIGYYLSSSRSGFGSKCRSGLMKYVDDTKLEGTVNSEED